MSRRCAFCCFRARYEFHLNGEDIELYWCPRCIRRLTWSYLLPEATC